MASHPGRGAGGSRYGEDATVSVGDIFPTGAKIPFCGSVMVQDGVDRWRERMKWGIPTPVPSEVTETWHPTLHR